MESARDDLYRKGVCRQNSVTAYLPSGHMRACLV